MQNLARERSIRLEHSELVQCLGPNEIHIVICSLFGSLDLIREQMVGTAQKSELKFPCTIQ